MVREAWGQANQETYMPDLMNRRQAELDGYPALQNEIDTFGVPLVENPSWRTFEMVAVDHGCPVYDLIWNERAITPDQRTATLWSYMFKNRSMREIGIRLPVDLQVIWNNHKILNQDTLDMAIYPPATLSQRSELDTSEGRYIGPSEKPVSYLPSQFLRYLQAASLGKNEQAIQLGIAYQLEGLDPVACRFSFDELLADLDERLADYCLCSGDRQVHTVSGLIVVAAARELIEGGCDPEAVAELIYKGFSPSGGRKEHGDLLGVRKVWAGIFTVLGDTDEPWALHLSQDLEERYRVGIREYWRLLSDSRDQTDIEMFVQNGAIISHAK